MFLGSADIPPQLAEPTINPGGTQNGGSMNKCSKCGEEARFDEWSNYKEKICINCDSDHNGYFHTPKGTCKEPEEESNG